jgi:hypothetical protein
LNLILGIEKLCCVQVKGILDDNMSQYQYKGGSLAFFQNPSQPQGHRFAQDHTETINETTRRLTKVAHDADFVRDIRVDGFSVFWS